MNATVSFRATGPRRGLRRPAEVIDRARPLTFTFDGREVAGYVGDTIVSALMADGLRSVAQGRRLQTRRGVLTADRFDPSCLLQVDDQPNVPAAHRRAAQGQRVRSQHVWPSLRFDLKALNQRAASALRPAGELRASSVAAFLRPAYRWLAGRADVGGRLGDRQPVAVRARHVHPDVLVVGAGAAGLTAAEAAATAGARVLVVDADHEAGGWLRLAADAGVADLVRRVAALDAVDLRTGAVVTLAQAGGSALVAADLPDGGEELLVVHARQVVLASGLIERTLTFTGNDLNGVMLATGARRLADLWAVQPGRRAVVLTANEHGDAAVADLEAVGVEVAHVVDVRRGGGIRRAEGSVELEAVVLADGSRVAADLLVVAPGWTVDAALAERAGARVTYDRRWGRPVVRGRPGVLAAVGALAGDASLDEVLAHATVSGRQAAAAATRGGAVGASAAGGTAGRRGSARRAAPPTPPLGVPAHDHRVAAVSVGVVDFAEDVTAYELVDADPCAGARLLRRAAAAPAAGPTTRAELADIARRQSALAALADPLLGGRTDVGCHHRGGIGLGALSLLAHRPERRTPLHDEHAAAGARFRLVGGWLEPVDTDHRAGTGWATSGAQRLDPGRVELRDTGATALWELEGPDIRSLLAELVPGVEPPPPGRVVCGRLASAGRGPSQPRRSARPEQAGGSGEAGWAAVAGLAPGHCQVRVERADAARFEARLLTILHLERRHWRVHATSVGEALTGIELIGDGAADLAEVVLGVRPTGDTVHPVDRQPFGAARLWSCPRDGDSLVELRVPAGRAVAAWRSLRDGPAVPSPPVDRSAIPRGEPSEPLVVDGWLVSDRPAGGPLRLVDCSPVPKVLVQAPPAGALAGLLAVDVGRAELFDDGLLAACTAPGEWLLLSPAHPGGFVDRLVAAAAGEPVSVVDVTHGRSAFRLTGAAAPDVLAALSSLDLSDDAFRHGRAASGAVAGVRTGIVRDDLFVDEAGLAPSAAGDGEVRSYLLHCDRSVGRYLFERLVDAGRPHGMEEEGFARYRARRADV